MQPPRTRRRPWIRLGLVLASTLASLLAGEVAVRVLRPGAYQPATIYTSDGREVPLTEIAHFLRHSGDLGRFAREGPRARIQPGLVFRFGYDRPRWDYFDADGCITIATNSLGFRDLEFPVQRPPGELRILALGDSFTYGQGVQLETCWPQVLERMLEEQLEQPVEVINAGFAAGSHYPPGYVDWLGKDALAFEPELVVLGLCLNDLGDVPMLAYEQAAPEPLFGGASQLVLLAQTFFEQRRLLAAAPDFAERVQQDDAVWRETRAALVEIRDLLAGRGIGLAVAVFPMVTMLGDAYPYLGLHEMVTAHCAEHGIPCVDLLPRLRGMDERDLWVHPLDQHPNHLGHRLFAEGILEFLRGEDLIP